MNSTSFLCCILSTIPVIRSSVNYTILEFRPFDQALITFRRSTQHLTGAQLPPLKNSMQPCCRCPWFDWQCDCPLQVIVLEQRPEARSVVVVLTSDISQRGAVTSGGDCFNASMVTGDMSGASATDGNDQQRTRR
jgi:hypothetical protein